MARTGGWGLALCVLSALPVAAAIPQSERDALMALYTSTNGPGWNNGSGWGGGPGTECSWYGVSCDALSLHVTALDLHSNQLDGALPAQIADLDYALALILNFNQLSGAIPPELGGMPVLQSLWLDNNQLSGGIPPELGGLNLLINLHLSWNQLAGPIPPQLGSLANLRFLDLSYNQLEGPIPPELGNLDTLWELWLSSNRLSGEIPPQLSGLVNLQALSAYQNYLTGSIPAWLGSCPGLVTLDLSNNQLEGGIPAQLGSLANLLRLYLQGNRLSGTLPPELGDLNALDTLWLHSNGLTGVVPAGLIDVPDIDLRWNGLYTAGGPWDGTQTVAPDNVSATAQGQTSVLLTWTPIAYTANDGAYRVLVASSPGGPFSLVAETTDKTVSTLTASGLAPGTTYYFIVRSRTEPHAVNDSSVLSRPSATVSATTDPYGPGLLQLAFSAMVGSEGEAKSITVRRVLGTAGAVSVDYATVPGTAIEGVDFEPASGTLSWPDGDGSPRNVHCRLIDDSLPEGGETLEIELSNFTGGSAPGFPSMSLLTIQDSDIPTDGEGDTGSTGYRPAVAAGPLGNRLVAWSAPGPDGATLGIFGQVYSADGLTAGDQFQIDPARAGNQHSAAMAPSGAGGFVVVWISETGSKSRAEGDVVGVWLEPDGAPGSAPFQVNSAPFAEIDEVVVAARHSSNTALVVWQGWPSGGSGMGIYARLVDSSGAPLSAQITVDDGTTGAVRAPAVGSNDPGDAVVAWARADAEGWDDVVARRYDVLGTPLGAEITVNVDTFRHQTEPAVVVEPGGDFVVAWQGPTLPDSPGPREVGTDIHARRFASDGTPQGDPFRVNDSEPNAQRNPVLLINGSGDCWATWEEEGMTAVWAYAVSMPSCLGPVGGESLVNDPAGDPSLRSLAAALADDGAFTAVYVKDDVDEGDGSVVARALNQSAGSIFSDGFESGDTSAWSVVVP